MAHTPKSTPIHDQLLVTWKTKMINMEGVKLSK